MTAARAAGARTYAAVELQAAETALAGYDAAVKDRDYRQALRLVIEARDGAYAATTAATLAKAAAAREADRLITTLDALIRSATAKVAGAAGPRPGPQTAERLKSTAKSAFTALQKARALVAGENCSAAVSLLAPIVAGLQKDLGLPATAPGRRGQ